MRHRQTKGPATDRPSLNHRATPRLYIVPEYGPLHDSGTGFRWWYYINFRYPPTPQPEVERYKWYWTHNTQYEIKDKSEGGKYRDRSHSYLIQYDWDLIEYSGSDWRTCGQEYDEEEHQKKWSGKGGFLYLPASDDPKECPGGDYSVYYCDDCKEYVTPYSDDNGELVCPKCSTLTGIICDRRTADQIERARALASFVGPETRDNFERCLNHLAYERSFDRPGRCLLYPEDKFSFNFMLQVHGDGKWHNLYNGGLIKFGPHCKITEDGSYKFRIWDYAAKCERDATETEIHTHISWSTHT